MDELIRLEAKGKHEAIGRYDTIIWRIRSGYVIILYGSMALLIGEGHPMTDIAEQDIVKHAALAIVTVFSLFAFFIDLSFRIRQLRVVDAFDELMMVAISRARGDEISGDSLRKLLRISGEGIVPLVKIRLWRAIIFILLFYISAPIVALLLFYLILAPGFMPDSPLS